MDLLLLAGIPTAIGANEAVHQQRILDDEAEAPERQEPFYLDVYCDAQSKKKDEVHNAIVVLKDGKLRLWPKDPKTQLPASYSDSDSDNDNDDDNDAPHPFTGFYLPFPTEDLPHRPIPATPILGLVSTVPSSSSSSSSASPSPTPNPYSHSHSKSKPKPKPKLNWIYADNNTRELRYGPRVEARKHTIGPWDWTEDEQGLTLEGEECLVAVEEEKGGFGWAVYWDREDDRLKSWGIADKKRVLRCSLERRVVSG